MKLYSDEDGFLFQEDEFGERIYAIAFLGENGWLFDRRDRRARALLPELIVYELGFDHAPAPRNWLLP